MANPRPRIDAVVARRTLVRWIWRAACATGMVLVVGVLWLASGGPIGVDRWLDVTEPPMSAAAIVVLGGGTTSDNLPLLQGWERIGTAERLFRDGLAPFVVFSGGGSVGVSEAEAYANAAVWLGIRRSAMAFEPTSRTTADHGHALRGFVLPDGTAIGTDTPLLVVTSAFHSRRALMAFHRAGFTRVRIVSEYSPKAPPVAETPGSLTSSLPDYQPDEKKYNDVLFRLAYRAFDFFIDLREVGAILMS